MDKSHITPKIGVIGLKGLPAYGGAATVGENIVKRLKNDFDFVVYAVSSHTQTGYIPEGFHQKVFSAVSFHKINIVLYYIRSAFHAVFRCNYDLIHLHHIDGAFILPILRIKYKVIATAHARTFESRKWSWPVNLLLKFNEWLFLRFSNGITCVGKPLKETYEKLTNKKVHYIPNGIDLSLYNIPRVSMPGPHYILFAAGRIIPLKGLHLMLDALHNIHYTQRLVVLGDLNQIKRYKQEIIKLSEGLDIHFKGLIKDKHQLAQNICDASFFIFPSISETMSIMLLEVAALKVPVICSDIKANKAIFYEDEVLYFESGESKDLAEKISWAMRNNEAMKMKADRAFKKLENEFNWDSIVLQYKSLYMDLINS